MLGTADPQRTKSLRRANGTNSQATTSSNSIDNTKNHQRNTPSSAPTLRDPCLAARHAAGRAAAAFEMTTPPSAADSTTRPPKRRRTSSLSRQLPRSSSSDPKQRKTPGHHQLSHIQRLPPHTEPAPQDPLFTQSQLLRSISAALLIAGYDSARPSALESFRAQVEEYVLSFLADVRASMQSSRRGGGTVAGAGVGVGGVLPQDFVYALDNRGLRAADLEAHVALPFPGELAAPVVAPPAAAEAAPVSLVGVLGPELHSVAGAGAGDGRGEEGASGGRSAYIPLHFPALPSRHSYLSTPVFTAREQDARKIRERATEEGILAEKALRRLTSARVSGGDRRSRGGEKAKARDESWKDVMTDLLDDDDDADGDVTMSGSGSAGVGLGESAFGFDGAGDERGKPDKEKEKDRLDAIMKSGGLNVNHGRGYWRRGAGAVVR